MKLRMQAFCYLGLNVTLHGCFYKRRMNTMIMRKPSITAFKKELSPEQREELIKALKARFEENIEPT